MRKFAALVIVVLAAVGGGLIVDGAQPRVDHTDVVPLRVGAPTASPSAMLDRACGAVGTVQFPSMPTSRLEAGAFPFVAVEPGGTTVVLETGLLPVSWLRAFSGDCEPDQNFGVDGIETVVPKGDGRSDPTGSFDGLVAAPSGDLYLLGGTTIGWLIGRLLPDGRIDRSFGVEGWDQLTIPGEATTLTELSNGRLAVAGNEGGGCCVQQWVTELGSRGQLLPSFDSGGKTRIPPGGGSEITRIVQAPGDSLVVESGGGNMGCWYTQLDDVNSSGALNPAFERRTRAAIQAGIGGTFTFVGSVVPESAGFVLVGTGQRGCVGPTPGLNESGHVFTFDWNGTLIHDATFPEPMLWTTWAFSSPSRGYLELIGTPAHGSSTEPDLFFTDVDTSGRLDGRLPVHGRISLRLRLGSFPNVDVEPNGFQFEIVSGGDANFARLTELR